MPGAEARHRGRHLRQLANPFLERPRFALEDPEAQEVARPVGAVVAIEVRAAVGDAHQHRRVLHRFAHRRFPGLRLVLPAELRAEVLRERLGSDASKVPKRGVPNLMVRAMALFDPGVRSITNQLGKKLTYSSAKAEDLLDWSPRADEDTIVDCAKSLIASGAV